MTFLPRVNLSIRARLTLLVVLGMTLAVAISAGAFTNQHIVTCREMTMRHVASMADVLSQNVAAAISFQDADAARETLAALREDPTIEAACVYDMDGRPLADYRRDDLAASPIPKQLTPELTPENIVGTGELSVMAPVSDLAERVGTVFVQANLHAVWLDMSRFMRIVATILLATVACSVPIAFMLQGRVSRPVIQLAHALDRVSADRDYSIRVPQRSRDEIGTLYTAFNEMLSQIQTSEEELKAAHDNLEMRVLQRTRELTAVNSDLQMEVAKRAVAEQGLVRAQRELVDSAHKAGMAEVATGVLHNVGNVLNSVNVSANLIVDRLKRSPVAGLGRASEMIRKHIDDIGTFLREDERGRLISPYLTKLSGQLLGERDAVLDELRSLTENIEHIKRIVSVQQSLSKVGGVLESCDPASLVEDVLRMYDESIRRHHVQVVRQFSDLPVVESDRNKVLQVLVNLVQNALHALSASKVEQPQLTVTVRIDEQRKYVEWLVADNGVGIEADNLNRIFQHGYTTKKDGHGYGLHSSALAARELGGSLEVSSMGRGHGATFLLRIPCRRQPVSDDNDSEPVVADAAPPAAQNSAPV